MMPSSPLVKAVFRLSWLLIVLCFLSGSTSAQTDDKIVYFNDFEDSADPLSEWSNPLTEITPVGERHFLGQFGNDTVSLTLMDLPPHTQVQVSFDLFIIASMDGNNLEFGPDQWRVSVAGGMTLLHTTFSNAFASELDFRQAYPDTYPGGDHPGLTGADEQDTLGYPDNSGYAGANDSVYRLDFTFPHSENTLTLHFAGFGQEGVEDEGWAIDNVQVEVAGGPVIEVSVDIKPSSSPNPINPRSHGVIPVAILTTDTFDATTVDPLSVEFGPSGATEAHKKGHIEDVNHDGEPDLVLHFKTQATGIRCGDTSAALTGETCDGDPIQGSDAIKTVGCKK